MNACTFRLVLIAALSAGGIGLWFVQTGQEAADAHQAGSSMPAGGRTDAAVAPRMALATSAPSSVEDAARLLELGASGDLSVDMNTRAALDVLLASLGSEATPADFQRLEEALRRSMPADAATQAIALVRRYGTYHRAAAAQNAAQQTAPSTPEELKALLDKTLALRRQHFDEATARALFGAEEELTRVDMAVNAVQADPKLSAQEKATQINALRERMPRDLPGLQATETASTREMETQVATLQQQGAAPAQIEQVRQRYLGPEAAKALTEMEAQRDQWESRYQAYAQQKKAIVASASPDMTAQLESALRQHFKEEELAAARAYDRHRTTTP